jgi:hypothetical protein
VLSSHLISTARLVSKPHPIFCFVSITNSNAGSFARVRHEAKVLVHAFSKAFRESSVYPRVGDIMVFSTLACFIRTTSSGTLYSLRR